MSLEDDLYKSIRSQIMTKTIEVTMTCDACQHVFQIVGPFSTGQQVPCPGCGKIEVLDVDVMARKAAGSHAPAIKKQVEDEVFNSLKRAFKGNKNVRITRGRG